ncbi:MAG TPA: glycosyltransferase [Candidatus Eisenbacteria bacterium]|nr:glycosyltransferase [Candidatus Eisenbacteria bacterium]
MRILAVTNMFPTPDKPVFGIFVARQIEAIRKLGHQVDVEFIRAERSLKPYALGIGRVRARARSGAFDLVHAHYGLTGFVAAFQPLPLVVSFCGDDLLGTPDGRGGNTLKSRIGMRLSALAARRADGIICKSEGLRAALPRHRDRERARVIGNGVDTGRFSPGDRDQARARLGVSRDERLVLYPHDRTQWAVKRFDLARAAIENLGTRRPGVRLWEVSGVSPDAMPDYYRAADCLLLTSDHEGSPNVVKEALCSDLPVVSVDAGDVKRWMSLVPGCVMVERDASAIGEGLAQVLSGPGRVDGGPVRRVLSSEVVAGEIVALYNEVVSQPGRRQARMPAVDSAIH